MGEPCKPCHFAHWQNIFLRVRNVLLFQRYLEYDRILVPWSGMIWPYLANRCCCPSIWGQHFSHPRSCSWNGHFTSILGGTSKNEAAIGGRIMTAMTAPSCKHSTIFHHLIHFPPWFEAWTWRRGCDPGSTFSCECYADEFAKTCSGANKARGWTPRHLGHLSWPTRQVCWAPPRAYHRLMAHVRSSSWCPE